MADLLAVLLLQHLRLHAGRGGGRQLHVPRQNGQHAGALPPELLPAKQVVPVAVGNCLGLLLLMPLPGEHILQQLVRLLGQERQRQHCYRGGAPHAPA